MKDNLIVSGDLAEISDICGPVLLMINFGIAVKKSPVISEFVKQQKQPKSPGQLPPPPPPRQTNEPNL